MYIIFPQDESYVLDFGVVKLAFWQLSIKLVSMESHQDIADVVLVFIKVSWVDQDVVKVDDDAYIKKVFQHFIYIVCHCVKQQLHIIPKWWLYVIPIPNHNTTSTATCC